MPRSVIEDQLLTAVLAARPLPDLALDAVVAGIPLLECHRGSTATRIDIAWNEQDPGLL